MSIFVTHGHEKSEIHRAWRFFGGLKEFPQVKAIFPIVHLENLIDPDCHENNSMNRKSRMTVIWQCRAASVRLAPYQRVFQHWLALRNLDQLFSTWSYPWDRS